MARVIATLGVAVVLLGAGLARAKAWEERRSWDWGQHRTSLFAEDEPRTRAPRPRLHDHWDDPAAPVRFADR